MAHSLPTITSHRPVGRLRSFATIGAGLVVHAILIGLPLGIAGGLGFGLTDPAILMLWLLAAVMVASESAAADRAGFDFARSARDRAVYRRALGTSLTVLLCLWAGQLERFFFVGESAHWSQWNLWPAAGVLVLGIGLRVLAVATLREAFVTAIRADSARPLTQHGVYRWLRHPSEAGLLAIAAGTAGLTSSWIAAAVGLGLLLPAVLHRVAGEDQELRRVHGAAFTAYRDRVSGLIPGVW